VEKNILTRDNVEKYEFFNSSSLCTTGNAYENEKGENCLSKDPEVSVIFKQPNLATVLSVGVQVESLRYPGNVEKIRAVFINANNSIITNEVTGQPIEWTSPNDNATIKGYFPDVRGLRLKVLKTANNATVQRLRVKVMGCYSLGLMILFQIHFLLLFYFLI
jgi:hypothetical protein